MKKLAISAILLSVAISSADPIVSAKVYPEGLLPFEKGEAAYCVFDKVVVSTGEYFYDGNSSQRNKLSLKVSRLNGQNQLMPETTCLSDQIVKTSGCFVAGHCAGEVFFYEKDIPETYYWEIKDSVPGTIPARRARFKNTILGISWNDGVKRYSVVRDEVTENLKYKPVYFDNNQFYNSVMADTFFYREANQIPVLEDGPNQFVCKNSSRGGAPGLDNPGFGFALSLEYGEKEITTQIDLFDFINQKKPLNMLNFRLAPIPELKNTFNDRIPVTEVIADANKAVYKLNFKGKKFEILQNFYFARLKKAALNDSSTDIWNGSLKVKLTKKTSVDFTHCSDHSTFRSQTMKSYYNGFLESERGANHVSDPLGY